MASASWLLSLWVFSFLGFASSSSKSVCSHQSMNFIKNLQSQCPISYYSYLPLALEVDSEFIDGKFSSKWREAYTSILFYGSSCPFSHNLHLTFQVLSSMFPQIEHLAIEQSSAMPSTFSQHGIHSLPTIIMVNKSLKLRYQGAKDLHSLVNFYKETTGLEPIHCVASDQPGRTNSSQKFIMQSWIGSSALEVLKRETYLLLCVLFLCIRAFLHVFPLVLYRVKALWISYQPLQKTSHMFERILQMINDVKRVWTILKLNNTRNFHEGAKNAHIWASSLASFSLQKNPTS